MAEYQRLGDYIREANVRNKDLKVTKLVGLTIDKAFIPSVANVIGTDLSNYKVIRKEQFACSLMQACRQSLLLRMALPHCQSRMASSLKHVPMGVC